MNHTPNLAPSELQERLDALEAGLTGTLRRYGAEEGQLSRDPIGAWR